MTSPGASPGTVEVHPEAPPPAIRLIAYGPTEYIEKQIKDPKQLPREMSTSRVAWVNVDGLGEAGIIRKLGEIFGLHALALEDVVNVHQRAKVEEYADHLFIVARMVTPERAVESEQLSMFLGKNFVLTFQEAAGDCLEPVRDRLRNNRGRIRTLGPDYLAYALLDAVVDAYFPIADEYGDRLDSLDEELFARPGRRTFQTLHELRHDLTLLRRDIRPLRDALVKLMPDPHSLIGEGTQVYLRDCYDHTMQLIDLLDTYREMCSDLRDFYLSSSSGRMNETMRVLTIIATIFIPLSFIAGVYGMNFSPHSEWNMPELHWRFGYPLVLLLMLAVACGQLLFFRRKGWLGAPEDEVDGSEEAEDLSMPS